MIHSVFELGDTIVREVMVPRTDMVFIERDKTVRQALSLALRSGFSRIPVVGENEDDVVGIAYLKDIVAGATSTPGRRGGREGRHGDAARQLRPGQQAGRRAAPRDAGAAQIHVAIVIDEYGGTAGLVTIEDILEEIVGEITDEYDNEQPPVEWLPDGSARVTARLPVDELGELFGVEPRRRGRGDGGGLLAHALGRVPIAGLHRDRPRPAAHRGEPRRPAQQIGTVLVERENEDAP